MRSFGLVVSLILASATLACAQAYERPKHSVGDTWTFTHGLVTTVVKVSEDGEVQARSSSQLPCQTCQWVIDKDGNLQQVLSGDGKPVDMSAFGFLPIGMKLTQYPLEVKKTWHVEAYGIFRGDNVPYIIDCAVTDFRDVKTKAGTFKAYRIERSWKVKVLYGPPPTWSDAIWISPDTKGLVKFESGSRAPSFELESYKIAP